MKTKLLSLVLVAALCLNLVPPVRAEQPSAPNLALDATVLGDSGDAVEGEESKNLFDGNTTETKWCKYESNYENSWVVFQLEAPANVGGMTVYHAGSGINETAKNNTRAFKLQVLDLDSCTEDALMTAENRYQIMAMDRNWDDVCSVEENSADKTQNKAVMTGQRQIFRFQVMDPGSDQYIRIYEIELQEDVSMPTEAVALNSTNFPDDALRGFLKGKFDKDQNDSLSPEELAVARMVNLEGGGIRNVRQLTGLELFPNLERLFCSLNQLTRVDLSGLTALKELHINSNHELTELVLGSNSALTHLECGSCKLSTIDLSGLPNLQVFDASKNQLTKVDVSGNTKLYNLNIAYNQLTELDLSRNPELQRLRCHSNKLTRLDLSHQTKMTDLYGDDNRLYCLDVGQNTGLAGGKFFSCINNHFIAPEGTDLAAAMPGFDTQKITGEVIGGNFAGGKVHYTGEKITYNYNCGQGLSQVFTLLPYDSLKGVPLDAANFPDPVFRGYAAQYDKDKDGYLSDSEREIVIEMDLSGLPPAGSNLNLKGFKYFTKLTDLTCTNCGLKELDVSGLTSLKWLHCSDNPLESLNVAGCPVLESLRCSRTRLLSLDLEEKDGKQVMLEAEVVEREVKDGALLTELDPKLVVSRVENVVGGTIDPKDGRVTFNKSFINYVYDCGWGRKLNVTLKRKGTGSLTAEPGGKVLVTAPVNSTLVEAAYDSNGKMLSLKERKIMEATSGWVVELLPGKTAFLMDAEGEPFCAPVSYQ